MKHSPSKIFKPFSNFFLWGEYTGELEEELTSSERAEHITHNHLFEEYSTILIWSFPIGLMLITTVWGLKDDNDDFAFTIIDTDCNSIPFTCLRSFHLRLADVLAFDYSSHTLYIKNLSCRDNTSTFALYAITISIPWFLHNYHNTDISSNDFISSLLFVLIYIMQHSNCLSFE